LGLEDLKLVSQQINRYSNATNSSNRNSTEKGFSMSFGGSCSPKGEKRKGEGRPIQMGNVWKQDPPAHKFLLCLIINKSCMNPGFTLPVQSRQSRTEEELEDGNTTFALTDSPSLY